jgi:SAM-dependent methyltransferase
VLELGCSDGTNLISMARELPQSEFFGIDSASRAIAQGKQTIDDLSLDNVWLQQLDLMEFAANDVAFDYIIAHGVYSWVPDPVRDRILAICSECLSQNGIAYVSYNAYPGGHIRDMVREMDALPCAGRSRRGTENCATPRAPKVSRQFEKRTRSLQKAVGKKNLSMPSNTVTPPFITTISIR